MCIRDRCDCADRFDLVTIASAPAAEDTEGWVEFDVGVVVVRSPYPGRLDLVKLNRLGFLGELSQLVGVPGFDWDAVVVQLMIG